MHPRLPLALFALIVWSGQRLLSKVALSSLGTEKFYLLSAVVSLITYTLYLLFRPPGPSELPPALGLACLMAITFGVNHRGDSAGTSRRGVTADGTEPGPDRAAGGHGPERAVGMDRIEEE